MSSKRNSKRPLSSVSNAELAVDAAPPLGSKLKVSATMLVIAALAAGISITLFSPRFVLWNSFFLPEVDRVYDTLRQLENPLATIPNYVSRVLAWRLFFPWLGFVLGLTPTQFLLLPFIGCYVTLVYVAKLCLNNRLSVVQSVWVTILAALSPWFFVSTGWLAYFDSWLVLCLLVASFSRAWPAVVAACLIGPWIDERFVLALPVVVIVRWIWQRQLVNSPTNDAQPNDTRFNDVRSLWWIAGLTAIYPSVRLLSFAAGADPVTTTYTVDHAHLISLVPLTNFASGLWFGHRVNWVFVVLFLVDSFRTAPRPAAWLASGIVTLTALAALLIAGDMHRSLEMLFPVVIAGMLATPRVLGHRSTMLLVAASLASMALPAAHQLWLERYPIHNLYYEWSRQPPSPSERVQSAIARASQLVDEGDMEGAFLIADRAVAIDDGSAAAYLFRANLYAGINRYDVAGQDIAKANQLEPLNPDCLFQAAMLDLSQNRLQPAAEKLKRAAQLGGTDWLNRDECLAALGYLKQAGINP